MASSTNEQQPPQPSSSPSSSFTDWSSIIGKNVKTIDFQDAGKVVTILENEEAILIASESPHSSYNYKLPNNLVQGFEGPNLMLSIVRGELADYEISDINDYAAQLKNIRREKKDDGEEEIVVPVIEEKLNVSKKVITDEVTIIKEPVIETKTIEVSVMREHIVLEKRPVAAPEENLSAFEEPPARNTRTEIRVPLIHEEIKVKKEPYVKEEIVIRKKPRTETKTVNESVISEKVVNMDTSNTITQAS
jgi:uncharacterized protein (TIGR02271 family)